MAEGHSKHEVEIQLIEFFETLWDGKWKIIATVLIAAVISVVYGYKTNAYKVSTTIRYGSESAYLPYAPLNNLLKTTGYKIDRQSVFEMFVVEFNDYEEMIDVLSENDFVKQSLENFDELEKQRVLINFAKDFKIKSSSKICRL